MIGKRESFLPDWWVWDCVGLTSCDWLGGRKKKKKDGSRAVLLGDMVVIIAGVIGLFVLVVEVVVHVTVAVVQP